jgi:hypothetical protein
MQAARIRRPFTLDGPTAEASYTAKREWAMARTSNARAMRTAGGNVSRPMRERGIPCQAKATSRTLRYVGCGFTCRRRASPAPNARRFVSEDPAKALPMTRATEVPIETSLRRLRRRERSFQLQREVKQRWVQVCRPSALARGQGLQRPIWRRKIGPRRNELARLTMKRETSSRSPLIRGPTRRQVAPSHAVAVVACPASIVQSGIVCGARARVRTKTRTKPPERCVTPCARSKNREAERRSRRRSHLGAARPAAAGEGLYAS